ncbi:MULTISPECIES: YnbE family lipoprotein [Sphingomonas]|jgi:uncharacterized membrane protein|uniref:YnbE family lipoprotein n=1 Tax=Sphingomonas TaxID=13687 RepID=UPI001676F1DB|nr:MULTISPECIES: YnbE family lipoprotein [Sphingomonas]
MNETALTKTEDRPTTRMMTRTMTMAAIVVAALAQSACVTVSAPDKPIVINLNISVTQEVVYRLDGQAKSLIQAQPGIF